MSDMDPTNHTEPKTAELPASPTVSERIRTRLAGDAIDLSYLRPTDSILDSSTGLMTYNSEEMRGAKLLHDLIEVVERNLNRHLEKRNDWSPHELVPYSKGRNYKKLGGEDWSPEQSQLSDVAQFAMILNLLTEDNLPSYHYVIRTLFGNEGAWGEWVGRWTAEEANHSVAIRDYLVVTRGVDPAKLEVARMAQMTQGYDGGGKDILHTLAYVTMQEMATNVAHRNTGKACNDPDASRILGHIAGDERLHMIFYSNLMEAAFELEPNRTMRAVADEVMNFEMPGSNMIGFEDMAKEIAIAGIYDIHNHHFEVIIPTLETWRVFERTGLSDDGERAREELAAYMVRARKKAVSFDNLRPRFAASLAARQATAKS